MSTSFMVLLQLSVAVEAVEERDEKDARCEETTAEASLCNFYVLDSMLIRQG
jgi:hypothetical protein